MLVASPAPIRVIPSASTIGQTVGRGISTLSRAGGFLPVQRAVDRACHTCRFLTWTQRPTRYTKVKTTAQTPSTKCQYQETTFTPV